MTKPETTTIAEDFSEMWLKGWRAGMLNAAEMLIVSNSEIRLAGGEFSAGEMRSVRSILEWRESAIKEKVNAKR